MSDDKTPHRDGTLRRNKEIQLVWRHLKANKHQSRWCLNFLSRQYFIEYHQIYNILGNKDLDLDDFNPDEASIIYEKVTNNEYYQYLQD